MLYQVIVAAALFVFMLNLIFNLKSLKKPKVDATLPETTPFVSILVPARNEANNIQTCLDSLRHQDYPDFEVLVLDDDSSDDTAVIVQRLAAEDGRIRLLRGEPLPEDWAGKPFACHQLAQQAKGDWLLFVDADTIHAPGMLRSIIPLAIKEKVALLSGFPRQMASSLPQKVAIPVLYFIILGWLPLWWLQHSPKPRPSLAIGQFLLFPRDEYWRIGGHRAVQSRILEDVWLGVEINRHGGRHLAVDLSPVVSCNMYGSIRAMWEGFVKWIYSVAAISPVALLAMVVAAYICYLAPFYHLWNELFVEVTPSAWRYVIVFQVAVVLLMRWVIDSRFKEPVISVVLHPVGISFLFLVCFSAGVQRLLGAGVRWKERLYSKETKVD
jgi:chlorobactene glucosyltransferase